jgi:hypothetical protein
VDRSIAKMLPKYSGQQQPNNSSIKQSSKLNIDLILESALPIFPFPTLQRILEQDFLQA